MCKVQVSESESFRRYARKLTAVTSYGYIALWTIAQPLLPPELFRVIDGVLLAGFAAETALKLAAAGSLRHWFVKDEDAMWHRTDALVLVAAITAKALLLFNPALDLFPGASKLWHFATILGAVRVLRVVLLADRYVYVCVHTSFPLPPPTVRNMLSE